MNLVWNGFRPEFRMTCESEKQATSEVETILTCPQYQRIPPKLKPNESDPHSWAFYDKESGHGQVIATLLSVCCDLTDDDAVQVSAHTLWAKFIAECDAIAYG